MNFLLTLIYEGLENKYPQFKLDTGKVLFGSFRFFFCFKQHTHTNKKHRNTSFKKKCIIDTENKQKEGIVITLCQCIEDRRVLFACQSTDG